MLKSSYDPQDVTFLLTDLSGAKLEKTLEEREAAMQAGVNYAEMLPVEYEPGAEYMELFEQLLAKDAARIAEHIGVVTEIALSERRNPVLVSLARAGTPVGILMRRWAQRNGIETPHYSVSIVRDRGIDTAALDHITSRHDPDDILFVDGWTGKGAIVTELGEALDKYETQTGIRIPKDLAVVADPGGCATTYGTREDVLLPSACLNSTVCGLVSRTVLNPDLIKPGQYHGAKVYSELAHVDRSNTFLDAITAQYDNVATTVEDRWKQEAVADRTVTFQGAKEVRQVQEEFGLPTWHLVKPGIGETTRVLLRRMPWKVLVRPDRIDDLQHILVLAKEKGVPVIEYPNMSYGCMGLITPLSKSSE